MYFWWFTGLPTPPFRPWAMPENPGRRPCGQGGADHWLLRTVAEALLADPAVTGGHLDLRIQNGVVILDGEVDTADTSAAVTQRVWSIPGVADVCNALRVTGRRYWTE
jgi:osmotically-inducible protein OsmY